MKESSWVEQENLDLRLNVLLGEKRDLGQKLSRALKEAAELRAAMQHQDQQMEELQVRGMAPLEC